MKVYNYDPLTKEYVGASLARIDPLETELAGKNVYLLPAHATVTAPPEAKENTVYIFIDSTWVSVPDYRNSIVYKKEDATSTIVNTFGEIPAEYTLIQLDCEYPKWDKVKWVVDKEAKAEAEKEAAIQEEMAKVTATIRQQAIDNLASTSTVIKRRATT